MSIIINDADNSNQFIPSWTQVVWNMLLGFHEGAPEELREAFSASNSGAMLGTLTFDLALAFPAPASGCFPLRRRDCGGSMSMVLATNSSAPVPLDKILRNKHHIRICFSCVPLDSMIATRKRTWFPATANDQHSKWIWISSSLCHTSARTAQKYTKIKKPGKSDRWW